MAPTLPKPRYPFLFAKLEWDERTERSELGEIVEQMQPSCRAVRIVAAMNRESPEESAKRFLIVGIPHRMRTDAARKWLRNASSKGVELKDVRQTFASLGCTETGIKIGQWIFFREEKLCTVKTLLAKFGDLTEVFRLSGPGKYAARLKLSFSSSVESKDVLESQVLEVPDMKALDGTITTDGCGAIRGSFAKEIRKMHHLPSSTSLFHFRRGGVKGLLVAYPDDIFEKKICKGSTAASKTMFVYRPSMLKYKQGPTKIDIQNVPDKHPPAARLNYFFVVQLLSIGVKLNPIKTLLTGNIEAIKYISHDRQAALRYIDGSLDANADSFQQDVFEMLQAGHSLKEPTLRSSLKRIQQMQYTSLRDKLSINVPKSCYVYGVVDELGVLKEDEVYLNLCERSGVLESKVMVTRNPCYKPSDIRILKAVNCAELKFLSNCIVFPASGSFSIPNSMAGGDLDGDTFFVCWDQTIMPQAEVKPVTTTTMSLNGKKKFAPREYDTVQLNEHLIEAFCLLRGDRLLTRASNEWKRVVERVPDYAKGEYPLALAEIVEVALDLAKSGEDLYQLHDKFDGLRKKFGSCIDEQAKVPTDELRAMIPCDSIRAFTPPPIYTIDTDLVKISDVPTFRAQWAKHYEEGKRVMQEFNSQLALSIKLDKDLESVTGNRRFQKRRNENGSDSGRQAEEIKQKYIKTWFPASAEFLGEDHKQAYLRASAWYKVGYEAGKPTFAWLGARYLNEMKSFTTNGNKPGLSIGALLDLDDSASMISVALSNKTISNKTQGRDGKTAVKGESASVRSSAKESQRRQRH